MLTFEAGASFSIESKAPILPVAEPQTVVKQREHATQPLPSIQHPELNPSAQLSDSATVQNATLLPPAAEAEKMPQTDYKSLPVQELRDMAKDALRSFAPHGIQYTELVKEGVNSDILKQLYGELGIDIPSSAAPSVVEQPTAVEPEKILGNIESQITPASTASPSLERKDRIAQLLAAKSGRPGQARTTSGTKVPTNNSVTEGGRPSISLSQDKTQVEVASQEIRPLRTEKSTTQDPDGQGPSSLQISLPPPRQSTSALSSPFTSGIPGLTMMSPDEESHYANRPAKRPLDGDHQSPSLESSHKRRNTGLSSKTDGEAMDIEDSSSDDASEGEVVESPQPSKAQPALATAVALATAPTSSSIPPKPFATNTIAKLTPAQMAEKAEMLKAKFLKQRARQKALQDGLPTLDAEVSKTEHALAEQRASLGRLRQRIAGMETDLAKAHDEEQNLIEEIQSSEKQLQEGLSGREKYTEELQNLTDEQRSPDRNTTRVEPPQATEAPTEGPVIDEKEGSIQQADSATTESAVSDDAAAANVIDGSVTPGDLGSTKASSHRMSSDEMSEDGEAVDDARISDSQSNDEGEYVPNEAHEPANADLSKESPDPDPDDSDGSASMSGSASDIDQGVEEDEAEYEPPEDESTEPMEIDDDASSLDYEPTDTPIDLDAAEQQDSPVGQADLDETAVDVPFESAAASTTMETSANGLELQIQHELNNAEQQSGLSASEPYRADTMAPGRGLNRNSAPATPNSRFTRSRPPVRPLSNDGKSKSNSFSAYQSPLTSFPAYKYHEQFDDSAKDGYRSLTYSNRIDPRVPLCPTELAGEICQDAQCEEQHFRHLGLNGK